MKNILKQRGGPRSLIRLLVAIAISATALTVWACGTRGGAEKAGEKVDEALDKAGDVLDKDGPAEKAGEKVDEALE